MFTVLIFKNKEELVDSVVDPELFIPNPDPAMEKFRIGLWIQSIFDQMEKILQLLSF
jgi:hypothetical protein